MSIEKMSSRRSTRTGQGQSKTQMRDELNRMIDDFLSKGGQITKCKDCNPGASRKVSFPEDEIGLFI